MLQMSMLMQTLHHAEQIVECRMSGAKQGVNSASSIPNVVRKHVRWLVGA